ncbi:MAG: hypothetical protein AAF485_26615 [Chloroflexota bacterium]
MFNRKAVQNILLGFASIGLAFGFLEVGASFLPPPIEGPENAAESCSRETGWRGRSDFTSTVNTAGYVHDLQLNSLGMHDQLHSVDKPADTYRILMLGDSFVQAIQVPEAETSHQVLETRLNEVANDQAFEVISGGVGGWGTGQQLQYYREEGRAYNPDLVVLMVYLGNDVKDNLPGRGITVDGFNCYAPYFVYAEDQLDPSPWLFAPGLPPAVGSPWVGQKLLNNGLGWFYRHSYLYAQLEPLFSPTQLQASVLDFYIGQNETFDYALTLTQQLVRQLQQEATADGAEFVVVLISPRSLIEFSQLGPEERELIYTELPAMRRAETIIPPNEMLADRFVAAGLQVIDLFPSFLVQANPSGDNLYFKEDKHWNREGNQLAAETIHAWLITTDLIE